MERSMGGTATGGDNESAAQDLVYDAWECRDPDEAYAMFLEAVELDPDNLDAWLSIMDFADFDLDERIEMLKKLVKTGERKLGKKCLEEDAGYFWGLLETRPYMRVRSQLALRLMEAERLEESVAEHEEMLKLNPSDNQGIRYGLLACYLRLKELDGAQRLFTEYSDDVKYGAIFAWGYVLERFLAGELDDAKKALAKAEKINGYATVYFIGHRKLPKTIPGAYSPGSREEAIIAWDILRPAWQAHPEAQAWVKKNRAQK
jgi:tetratricopeptide (TPR) repeat protein